MLLAVVSHTKYDSESYRVMIIKVKLTPTMRQLPVESDFPLEEECIEQN